MLQIIDRVRIVMPLSNIQLLVRSQPGGLGDHRKFLTEHVHSLMENNRFVDLVIFSAEDGEAVHFNQSLLGKHLIFY